MKDLSAYSVIHAEALDEHEGPELLALAMFFGMTHILQLRSNQRHLQYISPEAYEYQSQAENIEMRVAEQNCTLNCILS